MNPVAERLQERVSEHMAEREPVYQQLLHLPEIRGKLEAYTTVADRLFKENNKLKEEVAALRERLAAAGISLETKS